MERQHFDPENAFKEKRARISCNNVEMRNEMKEKYHSSDMNRLKELSRISLKQSLRFNKSRLAGTILFSSLPPSCVLYCRKDYLLLS
jgi:hypothetical protein